MRIFIASDPPDTKRSTGARASRYRVYGVIGLHVGKFPKLCDPKSWSRYRRLDTAIRERADSSQERRKRAKDTPGYFSFLPFLFIPNSQREAAPQSAKAKAFCGERAPPSTIWGLKNNNTKSIYTQHSARPHGDGQQVDGDVDAGVLHALEEVRQHRPVPTHQGRRHAAPRHHARVRRTRRRIVVVALVLIPRGLPRRGFAAVAVRCGGREDVLEDRPCHR